MGKQAHSKVIENTKDFGEILKKLRKSQKITQRQLADYANLSVTSIGEIERGEVDVRLGHLIRLLKLSGGKLKIEYFEVENKE